MRQSDTNKGSINQSSLRLLKKKSFLTQTQEGCTIEFKNRKK